MLNIFKNNRGITIVEVIVSAGMTAIVATGIATMMQNSATEQRKVVLLDTLKNQKQKFEYLVRDQASWTATVNNSNNSAALFNYIRSSSQVTVTGATYSSPIKVILTDAAGSWTMSNFLGPADTAGNGLTEKGQLCTNFSTVAGTDSCPISYRLLIGAECPASATTCGNPQLKVVARLVYSPSSSGTLDKFRALIQTISGSDIRDSVADGKYDASVKRTSSASNRSFRIHALWTPGVGATNCADGGGYGTCTTAAGVHPRTWSEDYDTNGLVDVTGGGGANIRFLETGFYGCTIAVPAFATKNFTATLRNISSGGAIIATGTTNAGLWSLNTAVIEAKFMVTSTAHNYQVYQQCQEVAGGVGAAANCTLGFSLLANYNATPQTVMSMSCYKLDRSM
jgi:hypothetical protein